MLKSSVCRYEHFLTDWYERWSKILPLDIYGQDSSPRPKRPHRKAWEWCAIAQALDERQMLRHGRSGCGFAVGREPLAALFASRGAQVLATDLDVDKSLVEWVSTGQHAASLDALYQPRLISRSEFDENVRYQPADMRDLPNFDQQFDFIWSSCSIEHLGGLEPGLEFVEKAMALVKPGGVAVHTTEFNVASNDATIDTGWSVIYRRRDIEALDYRLRKIGCGLAESDFFAGDHPFDLAFDEAPWNKEGRQHVKLLMDGHLATSMILIIRKA